MLIARLASGEVDREDGTMSNDNPDTERRPRPGGETRIDEKRSAGHVALQAAETIASGAEWTLGALAATGVAMKVKGALGSKPNDPKPNDSKP
jgi:hypothetical protein